MADLSEVARLREIVAQLRAPEGCPWDREQTHESLRAALVEECYEAIEAIERCDDAGLREELGDLLLLVVMHAQMAGERGAFRFEEVVEQVCEKLIRRHPHVFSGTQACNSGEVLRQWEQIKRAEKGGGGSILEGHPAALPALLAAQTVQKKAARVGFDWDDADEVFAKIVEEIEELKQARMRGARREIEEETGDLLFSVVNLARKLEIDAETSLVAAARKFVRRFQAVEAELAGRGRRIEDATPAEMNALWESQKAARTVS